MRSLLAYSTTSTLEEKLTLRIRADNSGDIYLPTAWYSSDGTQDCDYEWMVSIDWGEAVEYSGTGSSTWKIRVGYWLTPLSTHTVAIKPKTEEYSWLRAFGYKWTDIASSLINIISDKSYKGYAINDIFAGSYYKAYQYYGCVNLINTDEELLPDTLQVIGDYYRYYEYSGCTSLVSNAEEKILKTVKVIWDYYRAYQYENCTNINRIDMRAINWAAVWNNYRKNQYTGVANDKKPVDIYIEWGIEEGGDWWLVDWNVKNIYVYDGLVSDYQTKLSWITSSKIKKNASWDNNKYEFIEFTALADSTGKIRIPVGWYSTSGTQDCAYDWMVSLDGGEAEEVTGTWSASYISLGSWLTEWTEHRVVIEPKTVAYWWGRAFGYYNTWAEAYIKELKHDSYKCFASNRLETWAHYKHGTFEGCTALINSYEKLPTSVTTVGDYYMKECYKGCTWLTTAFYEVLHKDCTVWEDYRYQEYYGCTSMSTHQWIAGYMWETYPTNYKSDYLTNAWDDLVVYMTRYEALASGLTANLWIADNNLSAFYAFADDLYHYEYDGFWNNITISKFKWWYYNYVCYELKDVNKYTKLLSTVSIPTGYIGSVSVYNPRWGGVNKSKFWNKITFWCAFVRNNVSGAWIYTINPTIEKENWERVIKELPRPESGWNYSSWWWSAWSGQNQEYGNRPSYDKKWNIYGQYAYNWANYDYFGIAWISNGRIQGWNWWQAWFALVRNFKMIFGHRGGSNLTLIHTDTYCNFTTWTSQGTTLASSGALIFSDDWMTMWRWDSDYTYLEQFTLSSPRRPDTAVTTWKTLNVSGTMSMSMDGKYLFVTDWTTLYQYTYEE